MLPFVIRYHIKPCNAYTGAWFTLYKAMQQSRNTIVLPHQRHPKNPLKIPTHFTLILTKKPTFHTFSIRPNLRYKFPSYQPSLIFPRNQTRPNLPQIPIPSLHYTLSNPINHYTFNEHTYFTINNSLITTNNTQ